MSLFRIDMLPAERGDCIWIEYGDPRDPNRLLIDGGTNATYKAIRKRLRDVKDNKPNFELLIITHVDSDHIGGILKLITDSNTKFSLDEIWFNGYKHLSGFEEFGPIQGEKLTTFLWERPEWNKHFGALRVAVPEDGSLLTVPLRGGMNLTILSPGVDQLRKLQPIWSKECRKAGLDPAVKPPKPQPAPPAGFEAFGLLDAEFDVEALANVPSEADKSEANGSSIAVLAEFEGRRVLLAGDAHPVVLLTSIRKLVGIGGDEDSRLRLDAFKLPHHGSRFNVSRELLESVNCQRYLFSTDGTGGFNHPDREAVARVIKFGGQNPELIFNYRTEFNSIWDKPHMAKQYGYTVAFSPTNKTGQTIEL